jgi:hypothetical protein
MSDDNNKTQHQHIEKKGYQPRSPATNGYQPQHTTAGLQPKPQTPSDGTSGSTLTSATLAPPPKK